MINTLTVIKITVKIVFIHINQIIIVKKQVKGMTLFMYQLGM